MSLLSESLFHSNYVHHNYKRKLIEYERDYNRSYSNDLPLSRSRRQSKHARRIKRNTTKSRSIDLDNERDNAIRIRGRKTRVATCIATTTATYARNIRRIRHYVEDEKNLKDMTRFLT